jgi:hypothetical protein
MPQAQSTDYIPVTPDNFARAESDMYFSGVVKNGGLGKFDHTRDPAPLDKQTVIRLNRDTLYSSVVFDLDAGPVTITLPDPGKRFMSMQVIDEDQYTHAVHYGGGSYYFHSSRKMPMVESRCISSTNLLAPILHQTGFRRQTARWES